ncbi:hypothetical protein FOCC_FOCC004096, partial [Frankliniella occidentalis]
MGLGDGAPVDAAQLRARHRPGRPAAARGRVPHPVLRRRALPEQHHGRGRHALLLGHARRQRHGRLLPGERPAVRPQHGRAAAAAGARRGGAVPGRDGDPRAGHAGRQRGARQLRGLRDGARAAAARDGRGQRARAAAPRPRRPPGPPGPRRPRRPPAPARRHHARARHHRGGDQRRPGHRHDRPRRQGQQHLPLPPVRVGQVGPARERALLGVLRAGLPVPPDGTDERAAARPPRHQNRAHRAHAGHHAGREDVQGGAQGTPGRKEGRVLLVQRPVEAAHAARLRRRVAAGAARRGGHRGLVGGQGPLPAAQREPRRPRQQRQAAAERVPASQLHARGARPGQGERHGVEHPDRDADGGPGLHAAGAPAAPVDELALGAAGERVAGRQLPGRQPGGGGAVHRQLRQAQLGAAVQRAQRPQVARAAAAHARQAPPRRRDAGARRRAALRRRAPLAPLAAGRDLPGRLAARRQRARPRAPRRGGHAPRRPLHDLPGEHPARRAAQRQRPAGGAGAVRLQVPAAVRDARPH